MFELAGCPGAYPDLSPSPTFTSAHTPTSLALDAPLRGCPACVLVTFQPLATAAGKNVPKGYSAGPLASSEKLDYFRCMTIDEMKAQRLAWARALADREQSKTWLAFYAVWHRTDECATHYAWVIGHAPPTLHP